MKRRQAFETVVEAFENKYSFLGKQFAEEFLLSLASWNIQENSDPDYRIRRHLLLFWAPGWLKSTLLMKAYNILGPELCLHMSDVSIAALRGTVDCNKFITPFTLKKPFAVCTEFGQLATSSETEVVQKLLNVLEEGIVTVSLAKISYLSEIQKEEIERKYPITFVDNSTFTYRANWILMAGTYNKKYLIDNALESRFIILTPRQKLGADLAKYVNKAEPFHLDLEAVHTVREEIKSTEPTDTIVDLPDEVYEEIPELTMRDTSYLNSYILCKEWWGFKIPKEEILNVAQRHLAARKILWSTAQDKVLSVIETEPATISEIKAKTGLDKTEIIKALKRIGARKVIDKDGKTRWKI